MRSISKTIGAVLGVVISQLITSLLPEADKETVTQAVDTLVTLAITAAAVYLAPKNEPEKVESLSPGELDEEFDKVVSEIEYRNSQPKQE